VPSTHSFFSPSTVLLLIFGSTIALVLLAGSMDVHNNRAYACEAGPGPLSHESLDNSAAVFSGKVERIQNFTMEGESDRSVIFFKVDRYWKTLNENDYKQLTVFTEIYDGGSCGYGFETGRTYLVYATAWSRDPNSLYTSIGTRTQPIEDAQKDLAFLGEGRSPTKQISWDEQINNVSIQTLPTGQEGQATSMILSIVGVGAAIAGAVAFFTLRRLKEK
jgi:hypothetical protein